MQDMKNMTNERPEGQGSTSKPSSQPLIGDQGASQNLTTPTQPGDTLEDGDGKRGVTEGQFRRDLNVPIRIIQ